MRWEERLFAVLDDLEGEAAAAFEADREAELADRSRAEYAQVTLASRLVASLGLQVVLDVVGAGRVEGELLRAGSDWCLLGTPRRDWLVRLAAVAAVGGAASRSVPEVAWTPLQRLGLGSALRRLADSGETCTFRTLDGARHDVVVERVGHDFAEVRSAAGTPLLLPYAALAAVQSEEA